MTTTKLDTVEIVNGSFSDVTEGKKGNFTGEDASGEQFFIAKKKMNAMGFTTDEDVKPFFITVVEKTFNVLDADEKPVIDPETGKAETFTRIQAGATFKTAEEAIMATLGTDLRRLQAKKIMQDRAKELELDASTIAQLVASI